MTLKKKTEQKEGEDKVWITIERTINLGNYESYKVQAGLSQTIDGDPFEQLEDMETQLQQFVMDKTSEVLETLTDRITPKRKKKR